jgi:hypothetical protein
MNEPQNFFARCASPAGTSKWTMLDIAPPCSVR